MFKKYSSDIHTTFKKKGDNQARNMFTKSVGHINNIKHATEIAGHIAKVVNSLEK
jgi:hypothetical protein